MALLNLILEIPWHDFIGLDPTVVGVMKMLVIKEFVMVIWSYLCYISLTSVRVSGIITHSNVADIPSHVGSITDHAVLLGFVKGLSSFEVKLQLSDLVFNFPSTA